MTTGVMQHGATMYFLIVSLIVLAVFAILVPLSLIYGEALKYTLGLVGFAYLIYAIFFGYYPGNGIDSFSGSDDCE